MKNVTVKLPVWQLRVIRKLGNGQCLRETMAEYAKFDDGTTVAVDDLSAMNEAGIVDYRCSRRGIYEFVFYLTKKGRVLHEELVMV